MNYQILPIVFLLLLACGQRKTDEIEDTGTQKVPFTWENANVYFLLIDRFYNGDPSNDQTFDRKPDGAIMRSFTGGDIAGITQKIEEGYFDKLGVNAIWFTPPVEQIHGYTDEGTGKTYGYHGYWTRDWTSIDPNFGTFRDLKVLVEIAHEHEIRILFDAVLNHTGPVTAVDTQWPDTWVRTVPTCTYQDFKSTVTCTLVKNLPDIRTERNEEVELPPFLIEKWEKEGKLNQELTELEEFFTRTGYPRAPRFYIIKWLTDYVRELGIDGFRVDTAKHTEPSVWGELYKEALAAFKTWKEENSDHELDDNEFFMAGEVYNYSIYHDFNFPMGDTTINFFENGFKSLINFAFKSDANKHPEEVYRQYSDILNGTMDEYSVINYVSSHDDSEPFDKRREKVFEAGTKLLLAPGAAQIYYGDETARILEVEGSNGDANLRSMMNWDDLENNVEIKGIFVSDVFQHWAKLGIFRKEHPAIGAGIHKKMQDAPYTFSRVYDKNGYQDKVIVVMGISDQPINVAGLFENRTVLKDYYSGQIVKVKNSKVKIKTGNNLILLGKPI
ncbi:alpha-amylase family glycosyl hydrolase [Bacteroidota bacterium]